MPSEPATPELVPQKHGGALRARGAPLGHRGSGGRPPNKLREVCRDTFGLIMDDLGPACVAIARAVAAVANGDNPEAEYLLARFRRAGWNPEQLLKTASLLAQAGLPRQSEIVLATPEVLSLVAEAAGRVYGPGRVEELVGVVASLVDAEG